MASDQAIEQLKRLLEDTKIDQAAVRDFKKVLEDRGAGNLVNTLTHLNEGAQSYHALGRGCLQLFQDLSTEQTQIADLKQENGELKRRLEEYERQQQPRRAQQVSQPNSRRLCCTD